MESQQRSKEISELKSWIRSPQALQTEGWPIVWKSEDGKWRPFVMADEVDRLSNDPVSLYNLLVEQNKRNKTL